jgi:hypothetical protein
MENFNDPELKRFLDNEYSGSDISLSGDQHLSEDQHLSDDQHLSEDQHLSGDQRLLSLSSDQSISSDQSLSSDEEMIDFNVPIIHENALLIKVQINHDILNVMIDTSQNESNMSLEQAKKLRLVKQKEQTNLIKLKNIKVLIDDSIFYFDFSIIDDNSIITSIGMKNLKKYNSIINIEGNYLKIGTQTVVFMCLMDFIDLENTGNYIKLTELGFEKGSILEALKKSSNHFDVALNMLTS